MAKHFAVRAGVKRSAKPSGMNFWRAAVWMIRTSNKIMKIPAFMFRLLLPTLLQIAFFLLVAWLLWRNVQPWVNSVSGMTTTVVSSVSGIYQSAMVAEQAVANHSKALWQKLMDSLPHLPAEIPPRL